MSEQHDYAVKCIKLDVYEVYKFEEGSERPIATYTTTTHDSQYKCNCPAGKWHKRCGHMEMVKKYRQMERSELPLAMITFKK